MNPISNQYANVEIVHSTELDKPDILEKVIRRYGDAGKMTMRIKAFGFEKPVASQEYSHFEKDLPHDNIKVRYTVAHGSAGDPMTFELDTTKIDSNRKYYPRVNDIITFHDETQGWIYSISDSGTAVSIVVRPNDETDTIPTVTAGDIYSITSAAFNEYSDVPDVAQSGFTKFSNERQIIKEAIGSTDLQLVTETWIPIYNNAQEFQGIYNESQMDIEMRMLIKEDGAFMLGKRITAVSDPTRNVDSDGYGKHTTDGLIPSIRTYGNTNTYTVGAFSVSKFHEYVRTLKANFVETDTPIWCPMGLDLYGEVEDVLKTYFADTNINYTRPVINDMLFKGNESLGASVNFKYLTKSGQTFLFDLYSDFSNPMTYGATGYNFKNMGMMIPLAMRKDPKSAEDIPTIGRRYGKLGAYNRRYLIDNFVGFGANRPGEKIQETRGRRRYFIMSDIGNQFFGLNQFILINPV